jgi:hypothetical protein
VGPVRTAGDGTFAVPLGGVLPSAPGWANLEVVAWAPPLFAVRSVPARVEGGQLLTSDGPSLQLELALAEPTAVDARTASDAPSSEGPDPSGPSCVTSYTVLDSATAPTVVGELHTWEDTTGTFVYSPDSDIEVGFSTDGSTWRVAGSVHVGPEGNEVQWNRGPRFGKKLTTYFEYRKYAVANPCVGRWYEVRAVQWAAGGTEGGDVSGFDGKCTTTYSAYRLSLPPGSEFTRVGKPALKFGRAFSVFGFSGGARSGFSDRVWFRLRFGSKYRTYWICGNDDGPSRSHRVFAGPDED